ncbi:MAG: thermonuclease family protein [Helicobacter sp.]|nr:thermonuclease family protein [Helicobacteraceae bacterium]MDY3114157.1 thermonuclease family protein [Helicobacter sp.]
MQVLFRILTILICLKAQIFSYTTPPLNLQVLMQSIYAPALFSVYSKDYGNLYCQLYGIASISKEFKQEMCEITKQAAKEMRHFAMKYIRNQIYLEQQYRLGYKNGWCFLQNGGTLLNAALVRDGYAVVQYFDTTESQILEELETLEAIARKEKRGLWNEWEKEMNCLKSALRQIAQDTLGEEEN